MPLIRDYTHSDKMDALTPGAEVLFVRLLLKADVAGNFYAHPDLIKNICFPLKTNVRTADILRWLKELSTPAAVIKTDPGKHTSAKNTALLRMYTGNDLKPYLHIFGYGQKLKYGKPKHPPPEVEDEVEDETEAEGAQERELVDSGSDYFEIFKKELLKEENQRWRENFCMTCKVELTDIPKLLEDFNAHCISGGMTVTNLKDYKTYLRNWLLNKKTIEGKNNSGVTFSGKSVQQSVTSPNIKNIGALIIFKPTGKKGEVSGIADGKYHLIFTDGTKGEALPIEILIIASAPRRNMAEPTAIGTFVKEIKK